jgi:Transposase DDE domain
VNRFRVKVTDFTRQRALTFSVVVVLILRGHKVSMQNALNKFFGAIGALFRVVTASAYSQARQKLNPEVFVHLNEVLWKDYYELYGADQEIELWHEHRLLGVDGSYLNVPDTAETRGEFSVQTNQHSGGDQVQALASVMYDLRNDIGLSAAMGRKQAEKNFLFEQHLGVTQAGDVLTCDRNYADYSVMAKLGGHQRHFVIRFPSKSFTAVNQFWASPERDQVVTLKVPSKAKAFVAKHHLPTTLQVRLVKVVLDTGEVEVLGTDLVDAQTYPAAEFKQVYGWRWGSETYYGRIKNIFEVERFSAPSVLAIQQDFYGVIFLATLESILSKPAQAQLTAHSQERGCTNPPKVNRAVSYVAVVDHVVELLCDQRVSPQETLAALHHLFQTNPTRHREGRKFERNKHRSSARKLRFSKYTKRVLA